LEEYLKRRDCCEAYLKILNVAIAMAAGKRKLFCRCEKKRTKAIEPVLG